MKGGRPITQKTQVVIRETQDNPEKPKQPDSDSDSDKDSVNQKKRFTPPTLEQIKSYITEQNYPVDSQKFFDHYETANWYRGKTKIKNWKACIRTWLNGNSGKAAYGADSI